MHCELCYPKEFKQYIEIAIVPAYVRDDRLQELINIYIYICLSTNVYLNFCGWLLWLEIVVEDVLEDDVEQSSADGWSWI